MPNIKDVANKANVSISTVSRVINNTYGVSEKTKLKVMEAVKSLNFTPNEIARNFQRGDTKIVAIIVPSINDMFYSEFCYYAEKQLDRLGYRTIISSSINSPRREIEYLKMMEQNKVSGIIAITYNDIDDYVKSDTPIVSLDRHFKNLKGYICSDNYEGGILAVQKLVEKGSKKIAYVGTETKVESETKKRKKGFIDEAVKLKVDHKIFLGSDEKQKSNLFNIVLNNFDGLDGVFVENDLIALEFIDYATRFGYKIPEDINVIGFDGIQKNNLFKPRLSTIVQPIAKLGEEAVNMLMERLSGEQEIKKLILPVSYFDGDTTRKI